MVDGLVDIDALNLREPNGISDERSRMIDMLESVLRENGMTQQIKRMWSRLIKKRAREYYGSLPSRSELKDMSDKDLEASKLYSAKHKYFAERAIHGYLRSMNLSLDDKEASGVASILENLRQERKPKSRFPADRRKMSEEVFWDVISTCRDQAEEDEDFPGLLVEKLESFGKRSIVTFQNILSERMSKLYRQDLWAIAAIVNGGFGSDDGFEYFRAWIISQGSEAYQRWLDAPEKAAEAIEPGDNVECELLLYAAPEAYSSKDGGDIYDHVRDVPQELTGEPWQEDDLPKLYPKLWKRFVKRK
ncbi:hypothetical protein Pan216_04470 [Planctomycetes bacterium Pan216]|uniref:DUF4240 domain-containing protein n=1 Tax=Kolteria novifilia TaxID=2527975 RepID=A0A518AY12_9BACT|nr:hypothetical protein Pan216_04470 [Planctomycetes bacterium Pan216]